jgi:antitoxin component of RelBE/YafQ-DinJ toxin-antitoxin module
MSAIKGRARRLENAPTVLLQARVAPEIRAEVQAAAAASGVSIAYYLETFLRAQMMSEGALPLVELPRPQQEELPIPAA